MMITENNCEEYFLLYTDNELSEAERSAVEAFAQQHPKYAAILNMLLQTKLSGNENVSFGNKDVLYKNAGSEIGIDNYEDYFLLYTDNELSEEERENTERFVLQHPQLQPEFILLQQTKLPAETIVFSGKEKLYKEEKRRRILPLYSTQLSVAAAALFIVALGWFLLPADKPNKTVAVVNTQPARTIAKPVQTSVLPRVKMNDSDKIIAAQQTQQKEVKEKFPATVQAENKQSKTENIAVSLPHIQEEPIVSQPTETEVKQLPVADINKETAKTASVLKPLDTDDSEEANTQTALSVSDDNNIAQPAVYKELNTDDDNHTLYVGAFQLNKAKVNGFLKSASRLLGSKSKQSAE